ncbi:MAG: hypothetical protein IT232_09430 [Flavobacteriales bacterium]|nr:hypothetical protein [Flavobacteriales bacterium]
MKKVKIILTAAIIGLASVHANAQFGKLKEKINSGGGGKASGNFEAFNQEKDEMGITGQYFGMSDKKSYGFRFVKEANGKIINELQYFEKKGTEPQLKLYLKESYYTKNNVKLFFIWVTANADGYVELIELEPGVLAQIVQTTESANGGPATLDAKRTVKDIYAKDQTKFTTYDIETAQAKVDMIIASLNTEKIAKETAEWMKIEVYAKNVKKVVFSNQHYNLQKPGYPHKIAVTGDGFKTELDMAGNMNFMAFFNSPPKVSYPGQQINIEYEMNGQKVDRETLRKKSAAWSNMVKIIETKDFEYRQSPIRTIREYNTYHSAYVQDYACIQLLYNNKDKFKVDQTYQLTVRFYANRDGENGDLLAEGIIKLKYTKEAKLAFEGDPSKPEEKGVWAQFEAFLNE